MEAPGFESSVVGVGLNCEEGVLTAGIAVPARAGADVQLVASELVVGAVQEPLPLAVVLADEQHVGRLLVVAEKGGPPTPQLSRWRRLGKADSHTTPTHFAA